MTAEQQRAFDILKQAYHNAMKAGTEPWDFADQCAMLLHWAMFHVEGFKASSRTTSSADFIWR